MGKELERIHHFVVGVFVAAGDVVYLLKGVKDEETASVLGGADAVLVVKAGVPKRLELPLLPRFGLYGDQWVVFVKGGYPPCRSRSLTLVGSCRPRWGL